MSSNSSHHKIWDINDKFKKTYPNLITCGTSISKTFSRNLLLTDAIIAELKTQNEFSNLIWSAEMDKAMIGLINGVDSALTARKFLEDLKEEQEEKLRKDIILKHSPAPTPFTLYNDDVIITLKNNYITKLQTLDIPGKTATILYIPSCRITIEVMDAKLLKFNEQIKQKLREKIKKHNEKGKEKHKKQELKKLDF